jgi:archaeal flagellin FlaB
MFCERGRFIGINIYTIKSSNHVATLVTPVSALTKGEFMRQIKSDDSGFTGLEAAIVLIAFVVVAAVFSYVVLGAGFFTTQKSQETVYKGVEQASTNIQMIGNVYGISTTGSSAIDEIKFSIGLAPGAPTIDLTGLRIVFSTATTTPKTLTYLAGATPTTDAFTSSCGGAMQQNDQCEIYFKIADTGVNTKMTFELRPAVGASLPFTKTSPPTITKTNVLY